MKYHSKFLAFAFPLLLVGCHQKKEVANNVNPPKESVESPIFDTPEDAVVGPEPIIRPVYQATRTRDTDVKHMRLEVSFNWAKQRLDGKAVLTISPYFYSSDVAVLDAKNFDIHKVALGEKGEKELEYNYDGMILTVQLDRTYKKNEEYKLYVEYTAKPNEFESGGSQAISSDKGLYFINPDSSETGKPTQIWTQGETEANSRWFPTVDSPNEKITQELFITVDKKYKTLSNGLLLKSSMNNNGTRTDYWKQDKPHAPYLVMMAIGDFAVVQDSWTRPDGTKMDVHYYVEKEYEPHAKAIFGDTPEMLTHFSELLGVTYPWDKYHQVIVRDYVSGAMENTSAVIHGEFFNQTTRELLDENNFSTIAHELFHHWFGDLVTCESWANLPLNESFANYSQYLWDEYKYGRTEADYQAEGEMMGYVYSAQQQGFVDMIRYDYGNKEEMFDANSYNKGGRILHMLRKYLGDEAFFEGLRLYLTSHQYQATEIDHLRLAFEEVSGFDLHWFFNQWFLDKGHPSLEIEQVYADGKLKLTIRQIQDFIQVPLYRLPVDVDVYVAGNKTRHRVVTEEAESVFYIETAQPELVVVDAERCLLAEIKEEKPHEQYVKQYRLAPLYADRKEAVEECGKKSDEASVAVVVDALHDKHWSIRMLAMKNLRKALRTDRKEDIRKALVQLAQRDSSSTVRLNAINTLNKWFDHDDEINAVYEMALADQSYAVMATGLEILAENNKETALALARKYQNENSKTLRSTIAGIYSENPSAEHHAFYLSNLEKMGGFEKIGFVKTYIRFVKQLPYKEIDLSFSVLQNIAAGGGSMWMKYFGGYQEIQGLIQFFEGEKSSAESAQDANKASEAQERLDVLKKMLADLLEKETDSQVLQFMGGK